MPNHPVVLAHGYLGFATLGPAHYFKNVAGLLHTLGASEVYATNVEPKASIRDRSVQLAQQIRTFVPDGKVNLIAHSMGGLDSRYLLRYGGGRNLIASLTTLGAPFRGTVAADVAANPLKLPVSPQTILGTIGRHESGLLGAWPFALVGQPFSALPHIRDFFAREPGSDYTHVRSYLTSLFSLDDQALGDLTTASCQRMFPDETDLQGIDAHSYAGSLEATKVNPLLSLPAILLNSLGQENDGVVSVQSASLQTHRQTLELDHLGLIGWGPTNVADLYQDIYKLLV